MSCDVLSLANPGVQKLHPYQAGKPTDELERELGITNIVKLASNENPLGLSESVKAALQKELTELIIVDCSFYGLLVKLPIYNPINLINTWLNTSVQILY